MKVGDVLNGYRIETVPTNTGGGMSQWSFAKKDGRDYFVKMFLAPKFPLDDGPGSPASKARKRAVCLAFEQRHLEIARRLDPTAPGGGNLVVPCDFFRVDATYIKVMERIEGTSLPAAHMLTGRQLIVILRTLVFSMRMLHDQRIVHADVKPDNVLVQQTSELYISKLIDFDEAYVVGQPPEPEHIVGDPLYYSPELLRYIKRDETLPTDALSTSSDIFSLGLLLHVYLVGDVPTFDRTAANYPAESLVIGRPLDISGAPDVVQPLLARMLAIRPTARPTIGEVIEFMADVDPDALVPDGPPRPRVRPTPVDVVAKATPPRPTVPGGAIPRPAATPPTPATPAPAGGRGGRPAIRSTMGRRGTVPGGPTS